MLQRILAIVGTLILYFCAGSFIAEIIMLTYWSIQWQLDRDKLIAILQIAQGVYTQTLPPPELGKDAQFEEGPSLEELIAKRLEKYRQLETQEVALTTLLADIEKQRSDLQAAQNQYQQAVDRFQQQLAQLEEQAKSQGTENVRSILESLKPSQAKDQLVAMLKQGQLDDVTRILGDMNPSKRAKILGEFATPEELQMLTQILDYMRTGGATGNLAAQTQAALPQAQNAP